LVSGQLPLTTRGTLPDEFAINQSSIDMTPMHQPLTLMETPDEFRAASPALPIPSPEFRGPKSSVLTAPLAQMPEEFSVNHARIDPIPERPKHLKRPINKVNLTVPGASRKSWR